MLRVVAGLAILFLVTSTSAQTLQTPECNAANIASTAESIAKMKDGKQKSVASDEISAASEALAEGKTDDCKAHLLKASLQTK